MTKCLTYLCVRYLCPKYELINRDVFLALLLFSLDKFRPILTSSDKNEQVQTRMNKIRQNEQVQTRMNKFRLNPKVQTIPKVY